MISTPHSPTNYGMGSSRKRESLCLHDSVVNRSPDREQLPLAHFLQNIPPHCRLPFVARQAKHGFQPYQTEVYMHTPPEIIIATYAHLRGAQDTMYDLENHGVPYPTIRLNNHSSSDPDLPLIEQTHLPDMFWSLSVVLKDDDANHVLDIMNSHEPLTVGRGLAPDKGRDVVDQGAIAWRHYVFVLPGMIPGYPETRGNSGTTGTLSTGAFAEGAVAENTPSLPGFAAKPIKPDAD